MYAFGAAYISSFLGLVFPFFISPTSFAVLSYVAFLGACTKLMEATSMFVIPARPSHCIVFFPVYGIADSRTVRVEQLGPD